MTGWLRKTWDRIRPWMEPESASTWLEAGTLAELGEATARWLAGEIRSQPGYEVGAGPDRETTDLIPALVAANRAGFVTNGSQPGCDGIGFDGQWWSQHAAVEGFADDDTLARLQAAAVDTGLRLTYGRPRRLRVDYSQALDGMFGAVLSRKEIAWMYGDCSTEAVAALQTAWQVCLQDPEYGTSDRLWAALDRFSGRAAATPARRQPAPTPASAAQDSWAGDPAPVPPDLCHLADEIHALAARAGAAADHLQMAGVAGVPLAGVFQVQDALARAEAAARAAAGAFADVPR